MMGYISEGHKRHVWCVRGVGEGATTPGSPASVTSESVGGGADAIDSASAAHARADTTRLQTDGQIY